MVIKISKNVEEPIYRQIRSQIIAGIASGELAVGQALPSVRRLASDLGINFHTVNKAYAVLRDEGYLVLRGRSGAYVAKPAPANGSVAAEQLADDLAALAISFRAKSGTAEQFISSAEHQACKAFDVVPEELKLAHAAPDQGAVEVADCANDAKEDEAAKGSMAKTAATKATAKNKKPLRKAAKKREKAASKQVEFVQLSLLGIE